MKRATVTIERRKHGRLKGKEVALVSLGAEIKRMWHLIDISKGGLAFRYLGGMEDPQLFSELVLLTKEASFCLEKIPFTVVADCEMNGRFLSSYTFRRCGVRFGKLTTEQSSQLQHFIAKFAMSPPLREKAGIPRPEERGRTSITV
jgi:PilZ domain